MRDPLVAALMTVGAVFMLFASLGILRMPDLFMRLSSCTKAATLGVASTLLATAVFFDEVGISFRIVAIILFVFLTAPVASHMIGRAAYFVGTPMWVGTVVNELRGRYDREHNTLSSVAPSDDPFDSSDDDSLTSSSL